MEGEEEEETKPEQINNYFRNEMLESLVVVAQGTTIHLTNQWQSEREAGN